MHNAHFWAKHPIFSVRHADHAWCYNRLRLANASRDGIGNNIAQSHEEEDAGYPATAEAEVANIEEDDVFSPTELGSSTQLVTLQNLREERREQ